MKKIFYAAMAVMALTFASCGNDEKGAIRPTTTS